MLETTLKCFIGESCSIVRRGSWIELSNFSSLGILGSEENLFLLFSMLF